MTHFCFRLPMNNWRPISAKTAKQNKVRIITSFKAFTDSMRAETIAFKPKKISWLDKKRKKSRIKKSRHYTDFVGNHCHKLPQFCFRDSTQCNDTLTATCVIFDSPYNWTQVSRLSRICSQKHNCTYHVVGVLSNKVSTAFRNNTKSY